MKLLLKYKADPKIAMEDLARRCVEGQVEADPAVVNLSGFETFFQERRPFFIEGANAFGFGSFRQLSSIRTRSPSDQ